MSSSSSSSKLKILLVGSVNGHLSVLKKKLTALQKSKAGPFDVCFCIGPFGSVVEEMPLLTYIQEFNGNVPTEKEEEDDSNTTTVIELAPNLMYLGHAAHVHSLRIENHDLIVASCGNTSRVLVGTDAIQPLEDVISNVSYVGCDLFLTSEWPQGIEKVFAQQQQSITPTTISTSYDVAELAAKVRARYHISQSPEFVQSQPFQHLPTKHASTTTFQKKEQEQHFGRFVSLAPVVEKQTDKKKQKFVHALGLQPLFEMGSTTNTNQQQQIPQLLPCPFTDEAYEKDNQASESSNVQRNVGFSQAQALRIVQEEGEPEDVGSRWQVRVSSSNKKRNHEEIQRIGQSGDSDTLFVHGLTDFIENIELLQALQPYQIQKVRRPKPGIAFLEFTTHSKAKTCLEATKGKLTLQGVELELKWALGKHGSKHLDHYRYLEEDSNSTVLWFMLSESNPEVPLKLKEWMELVLEQALAGDDQDTVVKAKDEPAIQVSVQQFEKFGTTCGNLQFASHAAASMALASVTNDTDGGVVTQEALETYSQTSPQYFEGLMLHWGTGNTKDPVGSAEKKLKFAPDSRTECWFCLASPSCERHLIVSINEEMYIALPKGPMDVGHVLVVPVEHTTKGAFVHYTNELSSILTKLTKHAHEVYQKDLFVFERAIDTKKGYHTHVQCVPMERGINVEASLREICKQHDLGVTKIQSDLPLSSVVGQPQQQDAPYFYAAIYKHQGDATRFVITTDGDDDDDMIIQKVPLQLGRQALAQAMKQPDKTHWQNCRQSIEEETKLTNEFRTSFTPYSN